MICGPWSELPPEGAPPGWPWDVLWGHHRERHLVWCLGCGGMWIDDGTGGECGCVCGDPSLPGYEDWRAAEDPCPLAVTKRRVRDRYCHGGCHGAHREPGRDGGTRPGSLW